MEEVSIIKEVTTDIGVIALRSDQIITFEPYPYKTTATLKDLKEMYEVLMELCEGEPKPYYSNNTRLRSMGSEEKAFIKQNFHHFAKACASHYESPLTKYITNMLIHLYRPAIPIKSFTSKEEAINWLKSFK